MGQSQIKGCKGCIAADAATDTVNVDPTLLSGKVSADGLAVKDGPEAGGAEGAPMGQEEVANLGAHDRPAEAQAAELGQEVDDGPTEDRAAGPVGQEELDTARREEVPEEAGGDAAVEVSQDEAAELTILSAVKEQDTAEHEADDSQEAPAAQDDSQEALAAQAKDQAETAAAQKTVDIFLKSQGFTGISLPRKKCCSSSYAIHQAVEENDAEMVQALLRCGADASTKNSAGKTPRQLAEKRNKRGSHDLVLDALAGTP